MRRRLPILLLAFALLLGTFVAGTFFHGDLPLWRILRIVLIHAGIYGLVLGTIMPRLGPRLLVLPAPRGLAALVLTLVLLSAFASFASIVGIVIAMYARFEKRMDQISQTLRTRDQEKEHALQIAREMRLSLLESHLHPHFLFNTLASIATLIPEAPDRAQKMVWSLSALFRSAINMTAHRLIPLEEEWRLMLSYLDIQKERLGERLSYTAKMAEDVSSLPVPAFSIQILVENSLKHAIEPRLNGGTVHIDAYKQDGKLVLDVIDDGPGFPENPLLSGSGLNNLQSRLALLFGGEAQLIIDSGPQGACVRLNIPYLPSKAPYEQ